MYGTSRCFSPTSRTCRPSGTFGDEFVNTEQPPASTTAQVAVLFHPDLLFEIEAIAYAPSVTNQSAQ